MAACSSLLLSLSALSGQACCRSPQIDANSGSSLRAFWCSEKTWTSQIGRRITGLVVKNGSFHGYSKKKDTLRVRSSQVEEPVTIDNSSVLVVGGGGVGLEVTKALAKAGSWVTALQRSDKFRKNIEELGAMLNIGDVMDPSTIEKALRLNTFDAVVCTVGGGTKNPEVDKDGCINVIRAAKKSGVKRFILVSSIGVGNSVAAVDESTLQVLKVVLEAKFGAEEELKSSGLAYTIVRPGGLLNGSPSGKGILTEDNTIGGLVSRADVASLIMKILFRKEVEFKTFSAIDSEKLLPQTRSLDGVTIFSLV